jgi:hypothetical protein
VVSTAFIRDFLIGEADIASFSCYSKPPASADGAFTVQQTLQGICGVLDFCEILHIMCLFIRRGGNARDFSRPRLRNALLFDAQGHIPPLSLGY